jgi:hypothetical protein
MCIAFDGAYLLEAPAADPGITDGHRPVPEIMPAGAGRLRAASAAPPDIAAGRRAGPGP